MTRKLARLAVIVAAAASMSACLIVSVERPNNKHNAKPPTAQGAI